MYNGIQKNEVFVGFKKSLLQNKDLHHPDVTKLCTLLCTLLLMASIFVMTQNVYMFSKIAVHQQHVNCLINTWVVPVKTGLLIECDTAFYAITDNKKCFLIHQFYGCSIEPSHGDSSFEYPQQMFWLINKKIIFNHPTLFRGLM